MPRRRHPEFLEELTPMMDPDPEDRAFAALLKSLEEEGVIMLAPEGAPDPSVVQHYYDRLTPSDRRAVVGYSAELDMLHEELEFCVAQIDLLGDEIALSPTLDLVDARLSVVYHQDNFKLRIHAYREKIFKLVNAWLRLGMQHEPRTDWNVQVLDALCARGLLELVQALREFGRLFGADVHARHAWVHDLRDRPKGHWPSLRALHLLVDRFNYEPTIPEQAKIVSDLSAYREQVLQELETTLDRLYVFRLDLIAQLCHPRAIGSSNG